MEEEVGRKFPVNPARRSSAREDEARDGIRVLVVDPILGSRFSLLQAASQPGFVVDASGSIEDAMAKIERTHFALVIADQDLDAESGLEFLARLRKSHADVARGLVTSEDGIGFKRRAIERAGLSFLLTKPWSPEGLRRMLRELFQSGPSYASWGRASWHRASSSSHRPSDANKRRWAAGEVARHHEFVLRGLLAGLNSCETQDEVFELLHSELAGPFLISGWLWLDETSAQVGRLSGDRPVEIGVDPASLSWTERAWLERARGSIRVTRLDHDGTHAKAPPSATFCAGWAVRLGGGRTLTGLVFADPDKGAALVSMLRELHGGLQMAFRRIRDAETRATAARDLARRVSAELRMPVGALTHAIDRLRGEAERAGISNEWVERISSESERVARAVEHLEGEMLSEPVGGTVTAG